MSNIPTSSANRKSRSRYPSKKNSNTNNIEDDKLTINPTELDELIANWYETKNNIKQLEEKEAKYKGMIHKILDLTQSDAIKGKELQVTRRITKRLVISKKLLPGEIFDKYAKSMEISALYIKEIE